MTTLTDKELIKEIKERIGSLDVRDNIERRAYEIALASLEAEPVAWVMADDLRDNAIVSTPAYPCLDDAKERTIGSLIALYAAPPVPVIQADVAQAIENLKQKLVECNRYNYCADAVKDVEDASRVLALQNQNMSAPITPEAIENAIEYIRSIAFHIDEDDYHGKHIAYFMRQALAWLEGHSCSDDRLGKAENQTVHGNQAAESNRGNEWTGNPDIDNAIIMLDRIDTLESCDDDRIEAVKAVLRRLAGNSPVTPDGWISCSEQMPSAGEQVLAYRPDAPESNDPLIKMATYVGGSAHGHGFDCYCKPTHWMPLPAAPQEVNRG
ncbi:DUF551 domain-containing protein [Escherichia coli]|nr:DUF551 domain-containing protein [Escherichia coli]EHA5192732.1 DUF551 domain-containing protein [Escherichia coli]EIL3962481.1 DUF551 domain-containing protein [Escherichia coli]EIM2900606.1 DUF551 domain-containing protein [Escherichia coli]EKR5542760.1 DUF551 domain-containing protein [Escherichia coli]